jgi:hypothetical protein
MSLKNRYLAIIYGGCIRGENLREIHKKLYKETINSKVKDSALLRMMIKASNKAKKVYFKDESDLALALFTLFKNEKFNDRAKITINKQLIAKTEKMKANIIDRYIKESRDSDKYFYLASSHNDCAKDHKDYQGKLYIDNRAPEEDMKYARSHNLKTLQWVMDKPVYFITRPNCRHYFVSLSLEEIEGNSLKNLRRKYKTHLKEGDRKFQTPKTQAIEEYTDRLRYLKSLYREYKTSDLKNKILKTELLLKKWKKTI